MRLTNVAQMGLPQGRVSSLGVASGDLGRQLPMSFDQMRHVGMGERPGSWMGIAFVAPRPVLPDDLAAAWLTIVRRHATLHSVFARDDAGEISLHEVDVEPGEWIEHAVAPGQDAREVLREVLDVACSPLRRPSHRLCVVTPNVGPSTIVIGADHSHVDMWSLLVVVRDLLTVLDGQDPGAEPPGFEVHTAELRARPPAPTDVHERWDEILAANGGVMPIFPLPLGDLSQPRPEVVEVRDVLDRVQVAGLARAASRGGVRMLAVVVAAMTEVTHRLAGESLRAVFPVHSRYDEGWHDSVGWFITNAVLESESTALDDCARAIREAMSLGSWPLAEIFSAYGGMPAAPGMFAISWLDLDRLPVRIDAALQAQFVSAVISTDGVMVWFVRDDAGLRLRCRYPQTPEAQESVGRWLDELTTALRDVAS